MIWETSASVFLDTEQATKTRLVKQNLTFVIAASGATGPGHEHLQSVI
jgi:hypothetical protein